MVNNLPHESESNPYNDIHRFFEYSLDLFAISGFDGFLKRVNPAWEKTLGYSVEELLSSPINDLIHPDDRSASTSRREQTRTGTSVYNFENRLVGKDGSVKWFEWTAHPYPEKHVNYIVGRDVTERKRSEAIVRESEDRFRNMADAAPILIWMSNQDKDVIYYNQHWVEYRQAPIEQDLGDGWKMSLHPDDVERVSQMYVDAFDSRQLFVAECRLQHASGDYHWVVSSAAPRFTPYGEFMGYVGTVVDIHDRKLVENELRQSEQAMRGLLNGIPNQALLIKIDGTILALNEGQAALYGRTVDEMVGQNIYAFAPDNDDTRNRRAWAESVIQDGKPISLTIERGGKILETTALPLADNQGQVYAMVISNHDITHIKQMEAKLRQIEQTLRQMLNSTQDVVSLTDSDNRLIAFNNAFVAAHNRPETELIGQSIFDLLPPENATNRRTHTDLLLKTEQPQHFFSQFADKYLEHTINPVFDNDGQITGIAMFSHDITQLKETEESLRYREEQFRSVFESATEGLLVTNQEGEILLLNPQVEQMFGYSHDELIGQSVDVLLPESQRHLHPHHRQDYMANPVVRPMGAGRELFGRRKDGTTFPTEISLSFTQNQTGIQVMAFVTDITERKQIEAERLQQQRQQLELQQEREILELRQRFMSMVSHEFRTPLTVIASSCELLEHYYDRLPKERQIEKLHIINGQVRAMVGLLDDILQLGKIQAGAVDFVPEILDLAALCNHVLSTIQIVDQQHHQLQLQLSDFVPPIKADRRMLEHAVGNLLSNAVKYSPPGSKVEFSLSGNGEQIKMEIRDEGMGIPLEDQPHLFEPFYRAHNARQIEGTGLGLAIVKHNIEKHGGTISCRSIEGTGTTFTIKLPAAVGA